MTVIIAVGQVVLGVLITAALLALAFGLYFLPTLIASGREVPNLGSVVIVNLFLGWTLVGWVVALAMAARDTRPKP